MSAHDPIEGEEQVGSLAEEAARLAEAVAGWAHGQRGQGMDWPAVTREHAEHHDRSTCQYCPICRLIGVVQDVRPEVRQHLLAAAGSLAQAASALVESYAPEPKPEPEPDPPAEHIDVTDDATWGEWDEDITWRAGGG